MGVTGLIPPEALCNIIERVARPFQLTSWQKEILDHMYGIQTRTAEGKKRCQSVSSIYPGVQCEKRRKHNKTDISVVHQHGSVVWPDSADGGVAMQHTTWVEPGAAASLPLDDWWMRIAREEMEPTVEKAREYGSTDLIDIGMMLGRTMRREVSEEEAAELGVFFYLIGKIARWQSAIERGERPSDDTIFDIGIYCRMAQRIRYSGGWPGEDPKPIHIKEI